MKSDPSLQAISQGTVGSMKKNRVIHRGSITYGKLKVRYLVSDGTRSEGRG